MRSATLHSYVDTLRDPSGDSFELSELPLEYSPLFACARVSSVYVIVASLHGYETRHVAMSIWLPVEST